jgi:DNA-binding GntR family transcriptional regulator
MAKSKDSAARIERLASAMTDDIMYGAYEIGDRLKLAELQDRYEASQHEVRTVLALLASRRLVEHVPNAGFKVLVTDDRERADFDYVRVLLESTAARFVVARAGDEDIAELRGLATGFEQSIFHNGRREQIAANEAFHDRFYEICGNDVLAETIHELRNRYDISTLGRWRTVDGLKVAALQHHQLVDAIAARDVLQLERLIVEHIQGF